MFRYIENKDRTFLFGAYRGEKSQLDWILGEKTQRYEKLTISVSTKTCFLKEMVELFQKFCPITY